VTAVSNSNQPPRPNRALWVQCACVTLVFLGAAYASYRHGHDFAVRYGADPMTADLWPLIVDGMMTTATVELWKTHHGTARATGRWAAWVAFGFGVSLSLCANVAAAPKLSVFAVAVAACPPLALLLSVELLNSALKQHRAETGTRTVAGSTMPDRRTVDQRRKVTLTAEQQMWAYYQAERAEGRIPTGAELDRVAGTNNYGRRVLRKWRDTGALDCDDGGPDMPLPLPAAA
jgi:hypothetical protein